MTSRRTLLGGAAVVALAGPRLAAAQTSPGVTATEIRIGNTMSYSGPVSSLGIQGKTMDAWFRKLNDDGGIAGRKIKFLSYDDAYSPPKTVEQVRRLVEQDQVACLFSNLGTPTNSAVLRYTNQRKVPNLFPSTGADKWSNYQEFPGRWDFHRATGSRRSSTPSISWRRIRAGGSPSCIRTTISAATTSMACATCWGRNSMRAPRCSATRAPIPPSTSRSCRCRAAAARGWCWR
ncbi:ABC transporter substrate-binding protein [Dankookia sp. P2]|uniref:ABC transporter substrate-binding protein n=1 Tax=Dankookia sp. P2 TaxID=3423955 RepID=UPI003D675110